MGRWDKPTLQTVCVFPDWIRLVFSTEPTAEDSDLLFGLGFGGVELTSKYFSGDLGNGFADGRIGGSADERPAKVQRCLDGLVVIGDDGKQVGLELLLDILGRNGAIASEPVDHKVDFLGGHAVFDKAFVKPLGVANAGHRKLQDQQHRVGHLQSGNSNPIQVGGSIDDHSIVLAGEDSKYLGNTIRIDVGGLLHMLRSS